MFYFHQIVKRSEQTHEEPQREICEAQMQDELSMQMEAYSWYNTWSFFLKNKYADKLASICCQFFILKSLLWIQIVVIL